MRGKEQHLPGVDAVHGITPAYAGKSSTIAERNSLQWDHPRVCGEKTKKIP